MSSPFIKIMHPCSQNWNNMQPEKNGRMCNHCSKLVVDFTSFNRDEILNFLKESKNEKVCGRFRKEHVLIGYVMPAVPIIPQSSQQRVPASRVFMMAVGAMLLAGSSQTSAFSPYIKNTPFLSMRSYNAFEWDSLIADDTLKIKPDNPVLLMESDDEEIPVTGEPEINSSDQKLSERTILTEAQFNGGADKLLDFLAQNIRYPEWEEKNKIQGVVYVTFIVNKNGKVTHPRVVRSVVGSKNFDIEVLRVMKLMPDWIPAQNKNGNVEMEIAIPVYFKLKTK